MKTNMADEPILLDNLTPYIVFEWALTQVSGPLFWMSATFKFLLTEVHHFTIRLPTLYFQIKPNFKF